METFEAAVGKLLQTVDAPAVPFQIVCTVGNSSRGFQLGQGWTDCQIKSELWNGYRTIARANG